MEAAIYLSAETTDLIARMTIEGAIEPDPWLALGWLGPRSRTMDEWMGSPAHEIEHGPLVLGDFEDDDNWDEL